MRLVRDASPCERERDAAMAGRGVRVQWRHESNLDLSVKRHRQKERAMERERERESTNPIKFVALVRELRIGRLWKLLCFRSWGKFY